MHGAVLVAARQVVVSLAYTRLCLLGALEAGANLATVVACSLFYVFQFGDEICVHESVDALIVCSTLLDGSAQKLQNVHTNLPVSSEGMIKKQV